MIARWYRWVVLLLFISALLIGCKAEPPLGSAARPIVMGFVPSVETGQLLETTTALTKLLEEETGYQIEPYIPTDYAAVVEGLGAGKVDVAQLSAVAYVLAHDKYGAQTILVTIRKGKTDYRGQIIVRADSDIQSLDDLKGKSFAFVDPTSASGHIYPKAFLIQEGYDPDTFFGEAIFAGGHDRVIVAVMDGTVDAGAIYDGARDLPTIREMYPDVMEDTRVIAETKPIPLDTIVVRKDLPSEMVQKIKDAFLAVAATDKGAAILADPYGIDGYLPSQDSDYDPVREAARALGIDLEEWVKG